MGEGKVEREEVVRERINIVYLDNDKGKREISLHVAV